MLSERPWRIEGVVRVLAGIVGTYCFGLMLASMVDILKLGMDEEQRQFVEMLIMVLFFHVSALVWIGYFLRKENLMWSKTFGYDLPGFAQAAGLGLFVGLLVLVPAWVLQTVCADVMSWLHFEPVQQVAMEELQKPGGAVYEKMFIGAVAMLIAPVAEESIFRGLIYPAVKQAGFSRLALWGTSLLFGASHFNMVTLLPLTFFAVMLTLLYEATGNLAAPIMAHGVFNAVNFIVATFPDHFQRLERLLTF